MATEDEQKIWSVRSTIAMLCDVFDLDDTSEIWFYVWPTGFSVFCDEILLSEYNCNLTCAFNYFSQKRIKTLSRGQHNSFIREIRDLFYIENKQLIYDNGIVLVKNNPVKVNGKSS